jgi:FkbM family methyltransferase
MLIREIGSAYSSILRALGLAPEKNLDPETNGEYALLRRLATLPEISHYDCAIDVGAHKGEWTVDAMKAFSGTPIAKFFCVEPIDHLAAELRQTFAGQPNVEVIEVLMTSEPNPAMTIYNVGGTGRIYPSYRKRGPRASAKGTQKVTTNLQVRGATGDELFAGLRPYMVKIDCEGHDLHVLKGLTSVLRNARPAIQFEYTEYWIHAGSRLHQANRFLRNLDYRIFRLFPHKLLPIRRGPIIDTYEYQNFVAAPAEWKSLADGTIRL